MESTLELCLAVFAMLQTTIAARDALDMYHRRRIAQRKRAAAEEREFLQRRARTLLWFSTAYSGALNTALSMPRRLRQARRWWVFPSNKEWWNNFVMSVWSDEQWVHTFRMPRCTFFQIVDALRPEVQKKDTNMRRAIPVEERVAITLWLLANRCTFSRAAQRFGVGRSTVPQIFVEVVLAMELVLLPRTIFLGNAQEIMDGFSELGFPQVVGAMGGCRCQIVSPVRQGGREFIKRKHSILLQGTADHTGRFLDMDFGWSGQDQDSRMIKNSAIYETMEAGRFVPGNPTITLGGQQVGPLLLSDSAYPIRKWLMRPYEGTLNDKQALFNERLSHARNVVERAFEHLKSRWRCLTAPLEMAEETVPSVLAACVILHNICETRGKVLESSPHHAHKNVLGSLGAPLVSDEEQKEKEGEAVRDALADYFWSGIM